MKTIRTNTNIVETLYEKLPVRPKNTESVTDTIKEMSYTNIKSLSNTLATIKLSDYSFDIKDKYLFKDEVDEADTTKPVLLFKHSQQDIEIISGRHTLLKCILDGVVTIEAYVLEESKYDIVKSLKEYEILKIRAIYSDMEESDIIRFDNSIYDTKHDIIGCYANIWIRQKHFNTVGEKIGGHKHKYDHLSILASGSVKVSVDSYEKTFHAPTFITIPAEDIHNITALTEDVVWYCIFADRDINGDVYESSNSVRDKVSHGLSGQFLNSLIVVE